MPPSPQPPLPSGITNTSFHPWWLLGMRVGTFPSSIPSLILIMGVSSWVMGEWGPSVGCGHACPRTRKEKACVTFTSLSSFSCLLSLQAGNLEVGRGLREDELMQGPGSHSREWPAQWSWRSRPNPAGAHSPGLLPGLAQVLPMPAPQSWALVCLQPD